MSENRVIDNYDLKAHKAHEDEAALFFGFAPVPAFSCRQVQARKQREWSKASVRKDIKDAQNVETFVAIAGFDNIFGRFSLGVPADDRRRVCKIRSLHTQRIWCAKFFFAHPTRRFGW